jgi:hypothetical protein
VSGPWKDEEFADHVAEVVKKLRPFTAAMPVIVRVFCGKHDQAVAIIKDTPAGPMFQTRRPYRHFPKWRAQRRNPRFLAEFDFGADRDSPHTGFVDGPDSRISKAWCRKHRHPVLLDPLELREAVAKYRRGDGPQKLSV